MASNGPVSYYQFSPQQWLEWAQSALRAEPSPAPPAVPPHDPFDDVIADGGLPEARAFYRDERIRLLERAVGNCFMMAKREIARLLNRSPMDVGVVSDVKSLERWRHVQRFCETTGSKSDILRGQLPDELTEGAAERAAPSPATLEEDD